MADAVSCAASDNRQEFQTSKRLPAAQPAASSASSTFRCWPPQFEDVPTPFEGELFHIEDGTCWRVLAPVSHLKLQQEHSPCGARQVYSCNCIDEPWCNYGAQIVKIKFQIHATENTIAMYAGDINCNEGSRVHFPDSEVVKRTLLEEHEALFRCTNPTSDPYNDTINEVQALDRLGERECPHAPWLLGFACAKVHPAVHEEAIVGGYVVFTLMTRLSAKLFDYSKFCNAAIEERDKVREAFKTALNYIVDFEDVYIMRQARDENAEFYDEDDFRQWGLGEKEVELRQKAYS